MTRIIAMGLLGLSVLVAAPVKPRAHVTTTELVNFAPGGTIHLEDSYGSVSVEGWDRPEVELTVTRSQPGYYGDAKKLEKIVVKMGRKSDKELAISTHFPEFRGLILGPLPPKTRVGVEMDYTLRVPHDSHLAIHHKDGEVLITEVTGEIEATSRSGDIVVMLPEAGRYAIDAKVKLGTVYSEFGDAKHANYLMGERLANGSGTRVYLRTGVGGISIQRVGTVPSTR